jgi:hypothetical protein
MPVGGIFGVFCDHQRAYIFDLFRYQGIMNFVYYVSYYLSEI